MKLSPMQGQKVMVDFAEQTVTQAELIGIDTNVFARYFLQDDVIQSKIASDFLESLNQNRKGLMTMVVLVELFWILKQGRKLPKSQLITILDMILTTNTLVIEQKSLVYKAFSIYRTSSADFPDCLVMLVGKNLGAKCTVTFDKGAKNHASMQFLTADFDRLFAQI